MPRKKNNQPEPQKQVKDVSTIDVIESELTEMNPRLFDGISKEKKREILKSFSLSYMRYEQKSHSGPLPDPETLIGYDKIIPNAGDRLMTMAEKQQDHRMSIEKKVIGRQSFQSFIGQVFGFLIGLAGIGAGTYLAMNDQPTVGGIIAGGTVVSLVSVFVIGKRAQRKSIEGNNDS